MATKGSTTRAAIYTRKSSLDERADETETDQIFDLSSTVYPGYAKYRKRADHRVIRVFVLETDAQEVAL